MENNPIIVSLPEELQSGSPSVDTIKIFEDNGFGRDLSRRVLYLTGEINGGFNSDGEPCCRTIDIVNDIQRYNIKDRDLQIEEHKPMEYINGINITENFYLDKHVFVKALIKDSNTLGLLVLRLNEAEIKDINLFLNIVANLLLQ